MCVRLKCRDYEMSYLNFRNSFAAEIVHCTMKEGGGWKIANIKFLELLNAATGPVGLGNISFCCTYSFTQIEIQILKQMQLLCNEATGTQ